MVVQIFVFYPKNFYFTPHNHHKLPFNHLACAFTHPHTCSTSHCKLTLNLSNKSNSPCPLTPQLLTLRSLLRSLPLQRLQMLQQRLMRLRIVAITSRLLSIISYIKHQKLALTLKLAYIMIYEFTTIHGEMIYGPYYFKGRSL